MATEIGQNSVDKDKLKAFIDRCENIQGDIEAIGANAKKDCLPYREDLKQVKKDACKILKIKADVLNAALRQRKFERKAEKVRAGLDEDTQETFDHIMHALGDLADTPLGQAATGNIADTEDAEEIAAAADEPVSDEDADNVVPIEEAEEDEEDNEEETILAEPGKGGYEERPTAA